jgi:hypothetical protein
MMSTCVKWAKVEVEDFNTILARQLSSTERSGEVWTACMERVRQHAQMLSDVGLDFMNLIGRDVLVESSSGDAQDGVGLGLAT